MYYNLSFNCYKQKNAVSKTLKIHHLTFDNTCIKLKKMKTKADTLQELQKDGRIFSTIFYYTVLIILGPVLIFFGSKITIFDGILGLSNTASNVWSALVAIIALHIIVGMYIYRAYSEPGRPAKPDKID